MRVSSRREGFFVSSESESSSTSLDDLDIRESPVLGCILPFRDGFWNDFSLSSRFILTAVSSLVEELSRSFEVSFPTSGVCSFSISLATPSISSSWFCRFPVGLGKPSFRFCAFHLLFNFFFSTHCFFNLIAATSISTHYQNQLPTYLYFSVNAETSVVVSSFLSLSPP